MKLQSGIYAYSRYDKTHVDFKTIYSNGRKHYSPSFQNFPKNKTNRKIFHILQAIFSKISIIGQI